MEEFLEVIGAREHNLKNIDVKIPRDQLVVITGLSGSGKSSLAFDTIYAEGQRRYIDSFSAYARTFLGRVERPDVDQITGLSPVISIEQKTVNKSPRSTVGTITEVYDYLRLLFARVADAYSFKTGEKMVQYTTDQIVENILQHFQNQKILILAPIVEGRKGHYKELLERYRKLGFIKARIDKKVQELTFGLQLDRYKIHDIEIIIDKFLVNEKVEKRVKKAVELALKYGNDSLLVAKETELEKLRGNFFSKSLVDPASGISYNPPAPNTFSFNSPYGACGTCNGLGWVSEVDEKKIIPNKKLSIKKGAIAPLGDLKNNWVFTQIENIGKKYQFDLKTPIEKIPQNAINSILYGVDDSFTIKNEKLGVTETVNLNFEGVANFLLKQLNEGSGSNAIKRWAEAFMNKIACPTCDGKRLKNESLHFKIDEKDIGDVAAMDLSLLHEWCSTLEEKLDKNKKIIAHEILKEIQSRLFFLLEVGLDYLTLNRGSGTLSGGEAQRIRLATQIGSQLTSVLYILDEPSIGLHQRDNHRLIKALKDLKEIGNSLIVVEHDRDIMNEADYVIDIGPYAGKHGGEIVASGKPEDLISDDSTTGKYLKGELKIEIPKTRRKGNGKKITLKGASGNNLKNVNLSIPLGKFICITGVSGSGKSTLINGTLYPLIHNNIYKTNRKAYPYKSILGLEHLDKVIEIDQSPIGRTPRSNPATYTGLFTDIRAIFAEMPEAKIRGYKPGRFSFNVKGGRCETCQGGGIKTIEMNFLPNVYVECETCFGKRYNRETLEVRYKGKSISDVLEMTVKDAVIFFEHIPSIHKKIKALYDVGLGYISLGQSSTTLSGGEAQRVKLATELSKKETGNTLYILDEPTTGLHFEDIRVLLKVLNRLADGGNTVLIIEHNMDIIKVADHIIDVGPEGGQGGGEIIAIGTPEQIVKKSVGHTSKYLKSELEL
ncbi:MAG: excinuclease ABC subunit UvrA [Flavobacteriales bacterium]|nr:excinuclease ABC subunit UvrA [Flavobacteriales bacterium]